MLVVRSNEKPTPDSLMWLTNTRSYKEWLSGWAEVDPTYGRTGKKIFLIYKPARLEHHSEVAAQLRALFESEFHSRPPMLLYFRCSPESIGHKQQPEIHPREILRSWISQALVSELSADGIEERVRTILSRDSGQLLKMLFLDDEMKDLPKYLESMLNILDTFLVSRVVLFIENIQEAARADHFIRVLGDVIQPNQDSTTKSAVAIRLFMTDTSQEATNYTMLPGVLVVDDDTECNGLQAPFSSNSCPHVLTISRLSARLRLRRSYYKTISSHYSCSRNERMDLESRVISNLEERSVFNTVD
jgi:hypothetical protein